jgi:hypothetical protein
VVKTANISEELVTSLFRAKGTGKIVSDFT